MSDQNNQQGSTNPANPTGRKIAVPRRRLARAASSDGASNPMAGFSFGNTATPSGQPGFGSSTSAFGNQPQQSSPAFGRSFSEVGGFQSNMPQPPQQQSSSIDSSAPPSTSNTGFSFGSKPSFSFPTNKSSTDFQFGSGASAQQPASFSFGATPAASTAGGESGIPSTQSGFSFGSQSTATPLGGFKSSGAFGGSTMDEDAMDKDEAPAQKATAFATGINSSKSTFASTGANTSGFSFPASTSASSGFTFPAGGSSSSFKFPSSDEGTGFSLPAATTAAAAAADGLGATAQPEPSTTAATSSSAPTTKPSFSFGTFGSNTQTTLTSTPAFGFGTPAAAPTLSFGTPAASKESESEPAKAPATGFQFSKPTVAPAPAEDASPESAKKTDSESSTPKFSFGSTAASASPLKPASTFSFGSSFQAKSTEAADKGTESAEKASSKDTDQAAVEKDQEGTKTEAVEKGKEKEAEKSGDKTEEAGKQGEGSEETSKEGSDKTEAPPKNTSSDSSDSKSSSGFFGSSSRSSGELSTSQSIAIPSTPTFSIAATAPTPKKGTEAVDKQTASFIFSSAAKVGTQKPGATTSTFGQSALTVKPSTTAPSSEKPAEAPAATFSFGTTTQSSQPSSFSFGKGENLFKAKGSAEASSSASSSSTPAFSFGSVGAPRPILGATPGPSPFGFPSSPSTPAATTSAGSASPPSADKPTAPSLPKAPEPKQPATSSPVAPQPGTAFTFGATGAAQSGEPAAATSGSSPFSFGTPPSQVSAPGTPESSKKRKSSEQASAAETSRQKFVHGKSPLSQSWSAEEDGNTNKTPTLVTGLSGAIPARKRSVDSAGMVQPTSAPEKKVLTDVQNKENRPAEKHVSFKLPDGSEKGKTVDKPELVSPFKPLQSKPIEIPASQAPLSAIKSQSTSLDIIGSPAATTAEQTVIDSKIGNPDSIEKRTRYRDLPGNAQNELNLLYQFIEGQIDVAKKIETRQLAHNGELISEVEGYADRCTKELRLHSQSLTVTKENLHDLASAADYQVQNAMVAQLFFDNTSVHGRSTAGTTIHQRYFTDLADSLHERCGNFRTTINQLEERVDTMMRGNENGSTPDNIPAIIQSQSQTLMGLTAKVSDLHQEVEKMKRNYQTLR